MKFLLRILVAFSISSCVSGGYSFTGGDVGQATTVSIDYFPNYADIVQPQLSQIFTEKLRDIFVQQTPLELTEDEADMHFEGTISKYDVQPINAQADDLGAVAQSRLTIEVNVIFTNELEPKKSFEQRFSRFADFSSDQELAAVEMELMDQISQELSENILNQAIGNW